MPFQWYIVPGLRLMYKNTYIFGVVQEAFKSYSCLENKRLLYKKPHLLQSAQVLGNILHSV